jgi:tRNA-dihydrouridine synthase B
MSRIALGDPSRTKVVVPSSRFLLAPMTGISNMAFRLTAKEHGAGLVCTEMISAEGIVRGNPKTLSLMAVSPEEHPAAIQIFGNDGDVIARAAQIVETGADIIDLNFGCSARKVVGSGSGAAFLRKPQALGDVVSEVVRSVSCPVTVKIRSGWDAKNQNASEIARIAESSGAAAIIIHPRTRNQGFSGLPNWNIIADVKNAVSIPVIGNGDVDSPYKAKAMLESTGCDGVMIGRGALGNPWIFSRTIRYMETGFVPPPPTPEEKLRHLLKFARSLVDLKGEYTACREIRKFVKWYTKGMPQAKELRQVAVHIESFKELEDIVISYIYSHIYEETRG